MSDRAFLDTNIFIYDIDAGSPKEKQKIATHLLSSQIGSGTGVVSYQVIHEFINVALRKLATPLTIETTRDYLRNAFFRLAVVPSSETMINRALELTAAHRMSWCDALIVAAAAEADCSVLYSEDLQDGLRLGRLKIVNPFRGR